MSVALEVLGGPRPFRFDVQGALEPRLEPVWKEASEPPEVVEVREVWEVRGARLLAADGDPAALWQEWAAFLDLLKRRGPGAPVAARLVRDPAGAGEVVWGLGPPTHERFRVEQLGAGPDEAFAQASWRTLVPVTLVVSAVQRLADARGIVGWDQELASRFDPGGLHVLEWRTRITTREGTSALDAARRFGRIDVAPFGGAYTYDTNGPDGVEVTAVDADEPNCRLPTVAVAVSRLRQWGVHVGTTGPGTSPGEVAYSVRTRVEKGERSTTIRATARGPGALAWVEGHAPSSAVETSEVFHEEAARLAEGTWVLRGEAPKAPETEPVRWQLQTEVSGGHEDFDHEPVAGGYAPVLFVGALLPWRLQVTLKGTRRGGEGRPEDLLLPGLLPAPWRLDRAASREREPYVAEDAQEAEARLWAREATLVYVAAERPTGSPLAQLRAAGPVRSYYL